MMSIGLSLYMLKRRYGAAKKSLLKAILMDFKHKVNRKTEKKKTFLGIKENLPNLVELKKLEEADKNEMIVNFGQKIPAGVYR